MTASRAQRAFRIEAPFLRLVVSRLRTSSTTTHRAYYRAHLLRNSADRRVDPATWSTRWRLCRRGEEHHRRDLNFLVTPSSTRSRTSPRFHRLCGGGRRAVRRCSATCHPSGSCDQDSETEHRRHSPQHLPRRPGRRRPWVARAVRGDRRSSRSGRASPRASGDHCVFGITAAASRGHRCLRRAVRFRRSDTSAPAAVAQVRTSRPSTQKSVAERATAIPIQNEALSKQRTIQAQKAPDPVTAVYAGRGSLHGWRRPTRLDALSQRPSLKEQRKAERLPGRSSVSRDAARQQQSCAHAAEHIALHPGGFATRRRKSRERGRSGSAHAALDRRCQGGVQPAPGGAARRATNRAPEEGPENSSKTNCSRSSSAVLPGRGAVRTGPLQPLNGSLALVAGKGPARLFDPHAWLRDQRLSPPAQVVDAAQPDGQPAARAEGDHVDMWDATNRSSVATLQLPATRSASPLPRRPLIATGGADAKATPECRGRASARSTVRPRSRRSSQHRGVVVQPGQLSLAHRRARSVRSDLQRFEKRAAHRLDDVRSSTARSRP